MEDNEDNYIYCMFNNSAKYKMNIYATKYLIAKLKYHKLIGDPSHFIRYYKIYEDCYNIENNFNKNNKYITMLKKLILLDKYFISNNITFLEIIPTIELLREIMLPMTDIEITNIINEMNSI